MTELVITRGIPGSGKSTWAKDWVAAEENRARVNRDDLRMQLFGVTHGCDEQIVTAAQNAMLRSLLSRRVNVVLDGTNLNPRFIGAVVQIARNYHAEVIYRDFPVPLALAIARDAEREHPVGEDVIRSFYSRYTPEGVIV